MSGSADDAGELALRDSRVLGGASAAGGPPPNDELADALRSREAGGRALRGGAIRLAGYGLNAALGAVAAAFLFRHLGVTRVGIYVTAMSIAGIVSGVSDLGLSALGVRELAIRDQAGRSSLMRSLLGLRIVITAIGVACALFFTVIAGYKGIVVAGVALAGAGVLFQNLAATLSLSLVSRLRLTLLTGTEVGRQLLLTMLTIALVALGFSLLWFIGLTVPVGLALLAVTAWLVRREVPVLPRFDRTEWRSLLRQVLPYSVAVALGIIYFRLSVIFVSLTSSGKELGYFATSFRILEVLIVIPGLMVTGVFPIFARAAIDDRERLAYAVSRVFVTALIVGVWFALALSLGAPVAIHVIGGAHEFSNAIGVLRIQSIGLSGSFVSAVWSIVLLSLKRYREVLVISLAALLVGSILVIALASAYGSEGAALATAITEIGLAVATPVVIRRVARDVVPSPAGLARIALATALAVAVVLIPGLSAIERVLASSFVYAVGLWVLGVVPEELMAELRSARARYLGRARRGPADPPQPS